MCGSIIWGVQGSSGPPNWNVRPPSSCIPAVADLVLSAANEGGAASAVQHGLSSDGVSPCNQLVAALVQMELQKKQTAGHNVNANQSKCPD